MMVSGLSSLKKFLGRQFPHCCAGRNPVFSKHFWIPACPGVAEIPNLAGRRSVLILRASNKQAGGSLKEPGPHFNEPLSLPP